MKRRDDIAVMGKGSFTICTGVKRATQLSILFIDKEPTNRPTCEHPAPDSCRIFCVPFDSDDDIWGVRIEWDVATPRRIAYEIGGLERRRW